MDQVPPKELQLKTGMVAKDKLEANLTTHPHNAVLCEQLSFNLNTVDSEYNDPSITATPYIEAPIIISPPTS